MKKGFIMGVIVGGLVFGTVGAFAGQYVATENPFPVQLNGNNIELEGYNIEGSTYFKLRDIAEVIDGFNVGFVDNTIRIAIGDYSYLKSENKSSPSSEQFKEHAEQALEFCSGFVSDNRKILSLSDLSDIGNIVHKQLPILNNLLNSTSNLLYSCETLEETNFINAEYSCIETEIKFLTSISKIVYASSTSEAEEYANEARQITNELANNINSLTTAFNALY